MSHCRKVFYHYLFTFVNLWWVVVSDIFRYRYVRIESRDALPPGNKLHCSTGASNRFYTKYVVTNACETESLLQDVMSTSW